MAQKIPSDLNQFIETTANRFKLFDVQQVREKPTPEKWSAQEILGHLIDSAANNHQRFVRAQQQDTFTFPGYDQDHWVRVQDYNRRSWTELVELWRLQNVHLAQIVARIPDEKLSMECRIGSNEPVTLKYLIEDYFVHLRHHLGQIEEMSSGK